MPLDWDARNQDKPQIVEYVPLVPRHELPCLQHLDSDTRFPLTMYLRGAQESDQDEAKRRCATYGIDYSVARLEAQLY